MQEIMFNGLRFTIPDAWTNHSTLVFALPTADLVTPKAMGKQTKQPPANVTISWEDVVGQTPEDFLKERMRTIPNIFPGLEMMEESFSSNDMSFIQYKVPADAPFIQLVCAKRVTDRMVCITGTALEAAFKNVKEQFLATAQSLSEP